MSYLNAFFCPDPRDPDPRVVPVRRPGGELSAHLELRDGFAIFGTADELRWLARHLEAAAAKVDAHTRPEVTP